MHCTFRLRKYFDALAYWLYTGYLTLRPATYAAGLQSFMSGLSFECRDIPCIPSSSSKPT